MKQEIITRITSIYFVVALFAMAIVFKILYIQIAEKDKWAAKEKTIQYREIPAIRGNIYSENGRVLAFSVPYHKVRMDFASPAFKRKLFYEKMDSLAFSLAEMFGDKSQGDYLQELRTAEKNREGYHLLHSKVTYKQLEKLKNFPFFRAGRFSSGLITEQYSKRDRPHKFLAARTIGYTTKSKKVNKVGIEGAYDVDLRGINGFRLEQKLAGDGMWRPLNNDKDGNKDNQVEALDGKDVITTLNLNMMDIAENALPKQLS